jgi:hypothetical protein
MSTTRTIGIPLLVLLTAGFAAVVPATAATAAAPAPAAATTGTTINQSFTATGAPVTWTAPQGNTSVRVSVLGGGGGAGGPATGSSGALETGILPVTPGQTLTISVGAAGGSDPHNRLGGWGGMGGSGGATPDGDAYMQGGGGGGASTIETSPGVAAFVAGGGGGDGGAGLNSAGSGGSAGTDVQSTSAGLTSIGSAGSGGSGLGSGYGGIGSAAPTAAGTDGGTQSAGGGYGGGGGGGVKGGHGGGGGHAGGGGGGGAGAGGSFVSSVVQSAQLSTGDNAGADGSVTLTWTTYLSCAATSISATATANATTTIPLGCSSTYPLTSIDVRTPPAHGTIYDVGLTDGTVDFAATDGYTGSDSFAVEVRDASGGDTVIQVSLDITAASGAAADLTLDPAQLARLGGVLPIVLVSAGVLLVLGGGAVAIWWVRMRCRA